MASCPGVFGSDIGGNSSSSRIRTPTAVSKCFGSATTHLAGCLPMRNSLATGASPVASWGFARSRATVCKGKDGVGKCDCIEQSSRRRTGESCYGTNDSLFTRHERWPLLFLQEQIRNGIGLFYESDGAISSKRKFGAEIPIGRLDGSYSCRIRVSSCAVQRMH